MSNPNSSIFPNALPTDSDLMVASARSVGTLIADVNSSATTFVLNSGQGLRFTVPCMVQIDQEIVRIKARSGDNLQQIDRGFAGTSATPHAQGAEVRGYIMAWHHNQVTAEIKAICQALGVHLANVVLHTDQTSNGDITGVFDDLELKTVGTAGTKGGAGKWLQVTTDTKGRVTTMSESVGYNIYPVFYKAAIVQGTNSVLGFSFGIADAPNAVPVEGTNGTLFAVASFTQTHEYWVQDHFSLPLDWDGEDVSLEIFWRINTTVGNVSWKTWVTGMDLGSTSDPSFGSASTVTDTVPGLAYEVMKSVMTVDMTGVEAGQEVFFKFARAANDTANEAAQLIAIRWNIGRTFHI